MVVSGVDGAPMESMGLMGWVFENSSRNVGRCFQDTSFVVGDDSEVSFWHDLWCGDHPLKETFPELFSIPSSSNAFVVDHPLKQIGVVHEPDEKL